MAGRYAVLTPKQKSTLRALLTLEIESELQDEEREGDAEEYRQELTEIREALQ